jgi:chromosome segregation ATPase
VSHEPTREEHVAALAVLLDGEEPDAQQDATAYDALTAANAVRDKVWQERVEKAEAYRVELLRIAQDVGEPNDPFAAWEAIAAIRARATAAEADVAFLRRRRGELVIQRDEARQKGRANWCAWREALADVETWKARATAAEAALEKAQWELTHWQDIAEMNALAAQDIGKRAEKAEAALAKAREALRFAAGYISGTEGHTEKHPEEVLAWIMAQTGDDNG